MEISTSGSFCGLKTPSAAIQIHVCYERNLSKGEGVPSVGRFCPSAQICKFATQKIFCCAVSRGWRGVPVVVGVGRRTKKILSFVKAGSRFSLHKICPQSLFRFSPTGLVLRPLREEALLICREALLTQLPGGCLSRRPARIIVDFFWNSQ